MTVMSRVGMSTTGGGDHNNKIHSIRTHKVHERSIWRQRVLGTIQFFTIALQLVSNTCQCDRVMKSCWY